MRLMRPVSLAADAGESLLQPLVPAVRRQASVLERTGHRPWPVRRAPWLMAQTWDDLLFAHWRVPLERLRAVVPAKLPIDTFGGDAWLGVTPFVVRDLRLRGTPPLPALSTFAELNVRTYVTVDDKPGIWFLSLDASSAWAVQAARRSYRLPYFRAAIEPSAAGEWIDYRSSRTAADGPAAEFEGRYQPASERFEAAPGSLERFLAERYCLYTLDERGRVHRADIHHPPWPLQEARAAIERNTMAGGLGIELEGQPLVHFAARQDVVIWPRAPVESSGG